QPAARHEPFVGQDTSRNRPVVRSVFSGGTCWIDHADFAAGTAAGFTPVAPAARPAAPAPPAVPALPAAVPFMVAAGLAAIRRVPPALPSRPRSRSRPAGRRD